MEKPRPIVKGDVYPSNRYGDVVVAHVYKSSHIEVRFLNTGAIRMVTASNLRRGCFRDKSTARVKIRKYERIRVGMTYPTKKFGKVLVLKYYNARKISIRFTDTGKERLTDAYSIRNGSVTDYSRSIYGMGRVFDGKLSKQYPNEYMAWITLMRTVRNCDLQCARFLSFKSYLSWSLQFKVKGYFFSMVLLNPLLDRPIHADTCCFLPGPVAAVLHPRWGVDPRRLIADRNRRMREVAEQFREVLGAKEYEALRTVDYADILRAYTRLKRR